MKSSLEMFDWLFFASYIYIFLNFNILTMFLKSSQMNLQVSNMDKSQCKEYNLNSLLGT